MSYQQFLSQVPRKSPTPLKTIIPRPLVSWHDSRLRQLRARLRNKVSPGKGESMRKHNHGTKLAVAILCAGSLMTAMTSGANPLRRQIERGTIQTIDPQQSTLTVRDSRNGSSHSYSWNQDTKFLEQLKRFTRSKAIGDGSAAGRASERILQTQRRPVAGAEDRRDWE